MYSPPMLSQSIDRLVLGDGHVALSQPLPMNEHCDLRVLLIEEGNDALMMLSGRIKADTSHRLLCDFELFPESIAE